MATFELVEKSDGLPLHPFPEGWYFVASQAELRKRGLIHKTWLGEEIVAWRDERGRVCVAEAVCPHLGSSLAPEVGARVCEGRLVCPFHGFEYDATGRCVATPYALPPKSTRLRVRATQEIEGMVFAWHGLRGRPPQWRLPEVPSAGSGWGGLRFSTLRFAGHPQETTENSVDLAHLRYVHGYDNVRQVGKVEIDGAYLRNRFDFKTRIASRWLPALAFDVSATAHIHGMGYSQVDYQEHSTGYSSRIWILCTPIDGTVVEFTIVSQVGGFARPIGLATPLRLLPVAARRGLMNWFSIRLVRKFVKEDVLIWRGKRYLPHPRLNAADGELLAYRRYCEQFYEEPSRARQRLIASSGQ